MALFFDQGDGPVSGNSSTANQASIAMAVTNTMPRGEFVAIVIALDNNQTTDGDEGAVTSMTDTQGNTWEKAVEFTNGQGSAQAGATVSIWYSLLIVAALSSGVDTITANLSNSASRDKTAWTSRRFNFGGGDDGLILSIPHTNTVANDAADPGQLTSTSSVDDLLVRGIASESSSTTALTPTSSSGTWTAWTQAVTSGGGSAANMGVRAEHLSADLTNRNSDPTLFSADHASALAVFRLTSSARRQLPVNVSQAVMRGASW